MSALDYVNSILAPSVIKNESQAIQMLIESHIRLRTEKASREKRWRSIPAWKRWIVKTFS